MTRIALIHATVVSMDPTETAFSDLWPEAETFHLLDSSLSTDRSRNCGRVSSSHRPTSVSVIDTPAAAALEASTFHAAAKRQG